MIFLDAPPTRDRFVAEVHNLIRLRTRPICLAGAPRASTRAVAREFKGHSRMCGVYQFTAYHGGEATLVTFYRSCVLLERAPLRPQVADDFVVRYEGAQAAALAEALKLIPAVARTV